MTHKTFAYFGTPYVSRDTLAYLLAQGYRPAVVVTSPDAPKGRGMTLAPSETKALAIAEGLEVITPERITPDVIDSLRGYGCDYAIVVAYGKILPQALIEAFPLGVLNIHYSLLPKYRGASPVEGALLAGGAVTGVSIQKMVYELDAGDILATEEVAIQPTETTKELRPRLVTIGAELLVRILPAFEAGEITPEPQDHSLATKTGKIAKSDGELSLANDSRENWNKYRAYAESPGTYFFMTNGDKRLRVKVKSATFENEVFTPGRVVPEGKNETDYSSLLANGWSAA